MRRGAFQQRSGTSYSERESALRPAAGALVLHHARRRDGAQDHRQPRCNSRLPRGRADRSQRALRRDAVQRRLHGQGRAADHRRHPGRCAPGGHWRRGGDRLAGAARPGRPGLCEPLQAGLVGASRPAAERRPARAVRSARRLERGADRADRWFGRRARPAARGRPARPGRSLSRSAADAVPEPALHRDRSARRCDRGCVRGSADRAGLCARLASGRDQPRRLRRPELPRRPRRAAVHRQLRLCRKRRPRDIIRGCLAERRQGDCGAIRRPARGDRQHGRDRAALRSGGAAAAANPAAAQRRRGRAVAPRCPCRPCRTSGRPQRG